MELTIKKKRQKEKKLDLPRNLNVEMTSRRLTGEVLIRMKAYRKK